MDSKLHKRYEALLDFTTGVDNYMPPEHSHTLSKERAPDQLVKARDLMAAAMRSVQLHGEDNLNHEQRAIYKQFSFLLLKENRAEYKLKRKQMDQLEGIKPNAKKGKKQDGESGSKNI